MKLYEYMGFQKPSRENAVGSDHGVERAKDFGGASPPTDSKREELPDHVKIFLEDQQPLTSKQKILLKQILMEELK